MAHDHRFAMFGAGGQRVERCQGCFKTRSEARSEQRREAKKDEGAVQAETTSATVRPTNE
jgi:hypothetical protein